LVKVNVREKTVEHLVKNVRRYGYDFNLPIGSRTK